MVDREGADAVIYDEEFTESVTDPPSQHHITVESLISSHLGGRPVKTDRKGKMLLLTSETTSNPKGAKHSDGGGADVSRVGFLAAHLRRRCRYCSTGSWTCPRTCAAATAGKPALGNEIRILDSEHRPVPAGEVGQIFVRNSNRFDGYTSGDGKNCHDGFMASGDVGRLDKAGRL